MLSFSYPAFSVNPNIPVVGLSSCGHSVISLLSASVLISTQLPPINTQFVTIEKSNRHKQ